MKIVVFSTKLLFLKVIDSPSDFGHVGFSINVLFKVNLKCFFQGTTDWKEEMTSLEAKINSAELDISKLNSKIKGINTVKKC